MKYKKKKLYIFSYNVEPNGISGGETILIETFKRITNTFSKIIVFTWKPGFDLYTSYGLTNVTYRVSQIPVLKNFYLSFLLRTFYGIFQGLRIKLDDPKNSILFFSSDFWPDALAVVFLRLRYKEAKFISNFYLAAPNPFTGFNEKRAVRIPSLNGVFFWIMQKPIFWFSKRFADVVFVTSEPDAYRFPKQKEKDKVVIVKGGVNVSIINEFQRNNQRKYNKKIYDAVFMGRFHPQKGTVELIKIWKGVVRKKPNAKLIMIGDGSLMKIVKEKIKEAKLTDNIILTGYLFSSDERYKIFKQSKVVVHPALYDSGGMSAAEAMAFGLPAVSFDLLALKTYYPTGMIKVDQGNLKDFAGQILKLLSNKELYIKIQEEALELVKSEWDWDKRAKQIERKITSL